MKKLDFRNKTVIITGASSGIGKSLAFRLIKEYGATVYAIARGEEKLMLTRSELGEDSEKYIPYVMDASAYSEWQGLAQHLRSKNERIYLLINSAGVLPKFQKFEKVDLDEVKGVYEINLFSQIYSCKEIIPLMEKGGGVVNISSASALCPFSGVSLYCSSKSASERFSLCLSYEIKDISASCVMPGFVRTDIMKAQELNDKEARLIRRFSADCEKTVTKILKGVKRRKKRIIVGRDAHLLNFMFKFFPRSAPKIITGFLRKSGLELFKNI